MAGFTSADIGSILETIKKVLLQGGNRVRFPDGSEVQYANRKELLEEYSYWQALLAVDDELAPPSSFFARGSKGLE